MMVGNSLENNSKYGKLLSPDIKLYRIYFEELVELIGIKVFYLAIVSDTKNYSQYTEIQGQYYKPIEVGCIFDEHPTQQTLKKMGWVSELQDSTSIIHVPYDLPNIQQGALFYIPSGLDNAPNRLFRVTKLMNSIVYPASISCEIVPEFENTFAPQQYDYSHTSFNVLSGEEDYI